MNKQNSGMLKTEEFDFAFIEKIEYICSNIRATGSDPYSQLTGYLLTGESCYITRTGNARAMISTLDHSQLLAYVNTYLEK